MSSAAESVKHSSDGDVPDTKKVKVDEKKAAISEDRSAENNNGTANPDNNEVKKDIKEGNDADVLVLPNGQRKELNDDAEVDDDGDESIGEELDDEDLEPNDSNITMLLQSVQTIQQQISKLNEHASEEILKVEQKFNKLRRPHFEQRNALLKDIPSFWVTCLANHPSITHLIESNEDEACLQYLINVDVEELEDIKSGYNLKFHFKENPFFKNDVILRELRHLNSDEVISKSTDVEYKDTDQGRNLKRLVDMSVGQFTRTGDRSDQFSFFAWLVLPCETGTDDIAEIIKDQIWPSPLEFFFQSVDDNDSDDEDDDDDDSDEEDYDEEELGDDPSGEILEDVDGEELDDDVDDGQDDEEDEGDEE